jgi:hypothetical protein
MSQQEEQCEQKAVECERMRRAWRAKTKHFYSSATYAGSFNVDLEDQKTDSVVERILKYGPRNQHAVYRLEYWLLDQRR